MSKKAIIKRLSLANFKGLRNVVIDFNDSYNHQRTERYGKNYHYGRFYMASLGQRQRRECR
jgi:hypothetical protein